MFLYHSYLSILPMRIFVLALLALILISSTHATTLQGTVFDFSLQRVDAAVIEINTTPVQRTVTEDGKYSFEVPKGDYLITSQELRNGAVYSQAQELVSLPEKGQFTIDIIMFPDLLDDIETVQEPEELDDGLFEKQEDPYFFLYRALWVLFAILVFWGGKNWIKKQLSQRRETQEKKELPDELVEIVSIIRKHGGRMTQKDLRKEIPHSEAKVSLMIDDLQSQGKLKKIKKGRGNILILN